MSGGSEEKEGSRKGHNPGKASTIRPGKDCAWGHRQATCISALYGLAGGSLAVRISPCRESQSEERIWGMVLLLSLFN